MAIRGYFERRRERENAVPAGELEVVEPPRPREQGTSRPGGPDHEPADAGAEGPGEEPPTELPGADPAELAAMLSRAFGGGLPQVSTGSHQVEGTAGVVVEVVALLARAGALAAGPAEEGESHELDPTQAERLLADVRARLEELERPDTAGPATS